MNGEKISSDAHRHAPLPSMSALLAFERAGALLSFADAGRELNRTPSAVSHAIKEMEQRLGVTLFERVGRTVKLTRIGAVYYEAVQRSVSGLQVATDRLNREGNDKVVRISALPFFTSTILLPNLSEFEERYPEYDLRIETTNTYADILNGEADIGLRFGQQNTKDLKCEPLATVSGQPVASASYLKNSAKLETAEDLNHHTLLHVRQNDGAWHQWYAAHGGDELRSSQDFSFDSLLGSLDAAKRGLGIGLAMYPLIKVYPGYGTELLPVLSRPELHRARYNFVCKRSEYEDAKIQSVLRWLKTALAGAED